MILELQERHKRSLAAKKRWRDKNHDYQTALTKAWAKKNKPHINEMARAKYAKNPEAGRKKTKEKRDKNRARFNEWSRLWKKNSPGYKAKRTAYESKRRAEKAGSVVNSFAVNSYIELTRSKAFAACHYCGIKIKASATHFDHIVPLSKGGAHKIENICTACPSCNLQKSSKLVGDWQPAGQQVLSLN